jgi:hypothetical protein
MCFQGNADPVVGPEALPFSDLPFSDLPFSEVPPCVLLLPSAPLALPTVTL